MKAGPLFRVWGGLVGLRLFVSLVCFVFLWF